MLCKAKNGAHMMHTLFVTLTVVVAMCLFACICLETSKASAQVDEKVETSEVQPRAYIDDVLDTYYTYTCAQGAPGCYIAQYNETYRTITFNNSYERTGTVFLSSGYARECPHGGTATRYQCTYFTW